MDYIIRPMHKSEYHLLEDFQYEALFVKEGEPPFPRSIIKEPVFWNFITNFGKPGDFCLVAEADGKAVGAVWGGLPCGEARGYGYVDEETLEIGISVFKEYRGKGIGTALMVEVINVLKNQQYKQVSLSVQKENYAHKIYRNVGFQVVYENNEEFIMVCPLIPKDKRRL